MPTKIFNGYYCSVEEYRQLCGFRCNQTIYNAIRQGRLPGAVDIKKPNGTHIYLIPSTALVIDNTITHGGYIGVSVKAREAKKNYVPKDKRKHDGKVGRPRKMLTERHSKNWYDTHGKTE